MIPVDFNGDFFILLNRLVLKSHAKRVFLSTATEWCSMKAVMVVRQYDGCICISLVVVR